MVVAKKKQKTNKIITQEDVQQQQQEIITEKTLKVSKHKSTEKVIVDEVVDDLNIIAPDQFQQTPMELSKEQSEVEAIDTSTHLAPGKPDQVEASVSILPQSAIVTQEIHTTETEESTSFALSKKLKRVSISSETVVREAIEISEIDVKEKSHEIPIKEKPTKQKVKQSFRPNQSIEVSESITNDNVSKIISKKEDTTKATIDYEVHDATIISETIVSQSETELITEQKTGTQKATEYKEPVSGIEITEVHEVENETELKPKQQKPVQARYQLTESEPIEITEIITENTSDKYYPEIVVATEVATKSIVEHHKPYVSQEMHAPEKEDIFVSGKLPPQQLADVSLETRETVSISEQHIQETEQTLMPTKKPKTANATDTYTTHESLQTALVDAQHPAKPIPESVYERKHATIDVAERLTVSTSIVDVSESENRLYTPDETKTLQANLSYTLLESSQSSETFANEKELELQQDKRPTSSIATKLVEAADAAVVTEDAPLDTVSPLRRRKESKSNEASITYQLQDATEITSVVSHDKETDFKSKPRAEQSTATTGYDVLRSVQVTTQEIAEKEEHLEITETADSVQAKTITSHTLTSATVEEVEPSDTIEEVAPIQRQPKTVKQAQLDQHEETTVSETIPFDGVSEFKTKIKPDLFTATTILDEQKSIQVTTQTTTEQEQSFDVQSMLSQVATTLPTDTLRSIVVEEVEPSLSTESVRARKPSTAAAKIISTEIDETSVTEVIPYEGLKELQVTTKPVPIRATHTLDTHKSVQVIEQQTSDKEDVFKSIKNLESHIEPTQSTQIQKSVIVEEVQLSYGTHDVQDTDNHVTHAKIISSELEQTLVSETIPFEGYKDFKAGDRPLEGVATPALDLHKSLQILTQETAEKETITDIKTKADSHIATEIPRDTLKSIVVQEVEVSQTTSDVHTESKSTTNARVVSTELEQTETTEVTSYEGISDLSSIKPTEVTATKTYDEQKSIQISEQKTIDKEEPFEHVDKIDRYHATATSSDTLKSLTVEEVQASQTTSDVQRADTTTSTAKVVSSEFEQTLVSEVTSYEGVDSFKPDQTPAEGKATASYDFSRSLEVTQQEAVEKENVFDKKIKLDEHTAQTVQSHTLKSLIVEQVEISQMSSDVQPDEKHLTTAKVISSDLEPTTISEVMSYEALKDIKPRDAPTTGHAVPIYDVQKSIQVTEQETTEKEQNLEQPIVADQQVATSVPSHTLKSVQVEQIETSLSTGDVLHDEKPSRTAKIVSTEMEETTVTEVTTFEGVTDLTITPVTSEEVATRKRDTQKSVQVLSQEIIESEKLLDTTSKVDKQVASTVRSDTLRSVVVEETELSMVPVDLKSITPKKSKANKIKEQLDETTVSEVVTFEGIDDLKLTDAPDQVTASKILDTQRSIQITTQQISETEGTLPADSKVDHQHVTTNISHILKSITVEEVQSSASATDTDIPDTVTSVAKLISSDIKELHVSETIPYEGIDEFKMPEKPEQKLATTHLDERKSVTVHTSQVSEMEGPLKLKKGESQLATVVATDESNSLTIEETKTMQSTGPLDDRKNKKEKAKRIDNELHETGVSEIVSYEDVEQLNTITPTQKKGQTVVDTLESVLVQTHELTEKETEYVSADVQPDQLAAKLVPGHSLKAAVVTEMQPEDFTSDVDATQKTSKAQVTRTEKSSTTITETTSYENVENITEAISPEIKQAVPLVSEQSSVQVSQGEAVEKEVDFTDKPTFSKQSAKRSKPHGYKSAVVEETQAIPALDTLQTVDSQTVVASVRRDEREQTKTTETIVYESTEKYDALHRPESRLADEMYDIQAPLIISTTESSEHDQPLHTIEQDNRKTKPVPTHALKSAVTEQVFATDTIEKLRKDATESMTTKVTSQQFEQTSVTEVTAFENVEGIEMPQLTTVSAAPGITPQYVAEQSETQVTDSLKPYTRKESISKQATTDFEGLRAPQHTEAQPNETVSNLNIYRADDQTAKLLQQASEALSVQLIQVDTKESDLEYDRPTEQTARQTLTEITVAEKTEIMATNTVESLVLDTTVRLTNATQILSELSVPVKEETTVEERVETLAKKPETTTKKAKPSVKKLKAPVQTETIAENTVKPLQEQIQNEEHAIETTLTKTSTKIAETCETTTNETVETFDYKTRETRRASQFIDTFKTSIVEEITSHDTVQALEDIPQKSAEQPTQSKQPDLKNTVLVTEINTNELTEDIIRKTHEQQDIAHLVDTENLLYAKSEKQTLIQGRLCMFTKKMKRVCTNYFFPNKVLAKKKS